MYCPLLLFGELPHRSPLWMLLNVLGCLSWMNVLTCQRLWDFIENVLSSFVVWRITSQESALDVAECLGMFVLDECIDLPEIMGLHRECIVLFCCLENYLTGVRSGCC